MSNPADQISERNSSNQQPLRKFSAGDEFKYFRDNKQFLAKITDSTTDSDIWKIKLYENGYGTLTTPQDPTSEEIIAGCVDDRTFQIGQRVKVILRPTGMAVIVPDNLPSDTGFGKCWMIIDDQSPGNKAFDYPRFTLRG